MLVCLFVIFSAHLWLNYLSDRDFFMKCTFIMRISWIVFFNNGPTNCFISCLDITVQFKVSDTLELRLVFHITDMNDSNEIISTTSLVHLIALVDAVQPFSQLGARQFSSKNWEPYQEIQATWELQVKRALQTPKVQNQCHMVWQATLNGFTV